MKLPIFRALILSLLSAGAIVFSNHASVVGTIIVANVNDSGPGSLRQAIADAQPGDTIDFDQALAGQTISLSTIGDATVGPSALLVDTELRIIGLTGNIGVTIARALASPNMRLFYVSVTGNLTLQNITLSNGLAQGGNGGGPDANNSEGGGGGAAGLGGAIYNQGILAIEQCTLSANSAKGGTGGGGSGKIGR